MKTTTIFLLCTAMLLIGWHGRGIIHGLSVEEDTDRRLTRCLAWGMSSGLLTVNRDTADNDGETNTPATKTATP